MTNFNMTIYKGQLIEENIVAIVDSVAPYYRPPGHFDPSESLTTELKKISLDLILALATALTSQH